MKNRTIKCYIQQTCLVTALLLCLQPAAQVRGSINQTQSEVVQLEPGRSVEREIAGAVTHVSITLQAGPFLRVVLEQNY